MHWTGKECIYVSQAALIAFAWSAPMRDLANKAGMSDVGLKKILTANGVVTPPQGHWNRVHAGKSVAAPPIAMPRRPGETGTIKLDQRFKGLVEETRTMSVDGPFTSENIPADLFDYECQKIGRVKIPRNLDDPNSGLVKLLGKEVKRRTKADGRGWYWNEPVFDTALGQRQLRFLNELFHVLERRGHKSEVSEHDRELDIRFVKSPESCFQRRTCNSQR